MTASQITQALHENPWKQWKYPESVVSARRHFSTPLTCKLLAIQNGTTAWRFSAAETDPRATFGKRYDRFGKCKFGLLKGIRDEKATADNSHPAPAERCRFPDSRAWNRA